MDKSCLALIVMVMISYTNTNPVEEIGITENSPDKIGLYKNLGKLSNNSIDMMERIEKIKKDILLKLGLDEAPSEQFSRKNIPAALLTNMMDDEPEDINNENEERIKKKVIVIGTPEYVKRCGRKRCDRLRFKQSPSYLYIQSTQLWVYKKKSLAKATLNIFEINKNNGNRRKLLSTSTFHGKKKGWYAIELNTKKIVKETKISKKYIDIIIEMECSNCRLSASASERPFIALSAVTKTQKRRRRSTEKKCSSQSSCCRLPLTVDFKFIGWDNWVMTPPSYNAYYCNGNCKNDDSFHYQHTGILKAIVAKTKRTDIKLCCTPRKFLPLTMLYMNGGNLIRRVVDNMIVDECWCI